jgi:hypothetical protein
VAGPEISLDGQPSVRLQTRGQKWADFVRAWRGQPTRRRDALVLRQPTLHLQDLRPFAFGAAAEAGFLGSVAD